MIGGSPLRCVGFPSVVADDDVLSAAASGVPVNLREGRELRKSCPHGGVPVAGDKTLSL